MGKITKWNRNGKGRERPKGNERLKRNNPILIKNV